MKKVKAFVQATNDKTWERICGPYSYIIHRLEISKVTIDDRLCVCVCVCVCVFCFRILYIKVNRESQRSTDTILLVFRSLSSVSRTHKLLVCKDIRQPTLFILSSPLSLLSFNRILTYSTLMYPSLHATFTPSHQISIHNILKHRRKDKERPHSHHAWHSPHEGDQGRHKCTK